MKKEIQLNFTKSQYQIVDICTKPLKFEDFGYLVLQIKFKGACWKIKLDLETFYMLELDLVCLLKLNTYCLII